MPDVIKNVEWKPKRCPNCGHHLDMDDGDDIRLVKAGRELYAIYRIYCDRCGWSGEISEETIGQWKEFLKDFLKLE